MPEKTKQNELHINENLPEKHCESEDKGVWSEDQKKRSYYYDDSYGYEIYDPENDQEDDDL